MLLFRQRCQKGDADYSAIFASTAFSSSKNVLNKGTKIGVAKNGAPTIRPVAG